MVKSAKESARDWKSVNDAKDTGNFLEAFPTAVESSLVLPYDRADTIDRERDILTKRIAKVLQSLELTREGAEVMKIPVDQYQALLERTLQHICDTMDPIKGGCKMILLQIPSLDGTDFFARPFCGPSGRSKAVEAGDMNEATSIQ